MIKTKRWLDELPLESSERELLLVGKSARPAAGDIDANWQALCVALGTTAAASALGASSVAANAAVSTKVVSTLATGKVASASLAFIAAKSLAIGVTVGFAVMGAGALAERVSRTADPPATTRPIVAPTAARPRPEPRRSITRQGDLPVAPAPALPSATAGSFAAHERLSPSTPAPNQASAPVITTTSPSATSASLSQQARELAELKRLIDNGDSDAALRRLGPDSSPDTGSILTEERDALYVQALDRAQHREEARLYARRFLARYPHSPYFETIRRLLADK